MKIKKYALFVLILVVFAGFISPIMVARGFDPYNPALTNPNDPSFTGPPASSSSFLTCQLGKNPKLQHLLVYVTCIINKSVIPLIFALALVVFIWGVAQFIMNSDDEAKRTKGKQFMIWGIIALTVMVSVWGLVKILGNTFNIEYVIPQVKP